MAQARMLNRSVAEDEALAGLSVEAALFFLMAIPHLDRDGLITGHPRLLWSDVAPLRDGLRDCAGALIDEWVEANLVVRFGDGRPVLFFPGFQKNQSGMRYDRESPSKHPTPPGYERTSDGLTPISEALRLGSVEGVGSNSGDSPAIVPTNSDNVPTKGRNGAGSAPATVRSRAAARAAAEVQVQDQAQDQVQDESESAVVGDLGFSSHRADGVGKNACVREGNFAEAEVGEDGRIQLTQAGVMRQALREGRALSAGDLMFAYTDEQVLRVAYAMGSLLGLHMEWGGFERWLRKQDTPALWEFVWWCQFYSDLPVEKLQGIKSLPGLIQTNLRDGVSAPLAGNQRKAVAKMIERVEELGADVFTQVAVATGENEAPF